MDDLPRQKLRELIVEYGRSLCEDPHRCEALLKDHCGQYKREIFVLVSSMREGIAHDLRNTQVAVPESVLLPRLEKRLHDNLGLTEEIARWAVGAWVWALKPSDNSTASSIVNSDNFAHGLEAYNRGDYLNAVLRWLPLAKQGDVNGQCGLGCIYRDGRGVALDYEEAANWFRKAADQGSVFGQAAIGRMYFNGHGVPQDDREAVKWFRKAAEQGDAYGEANLGWMYRDGRGVAQDEQEAFNWFYRAAKQGNANAQNCLGAMYDKGSGVPQDHNEAANWYQKAAEQGNSDAQYNLGLMYRDGRGVAQDNQEAVNWFYRAAKQGDADAQGILSEMYEQRKLPITPQRNGAWTADYRWCSKCKYYGPMMFDVDGRFSPRCNANDEYISHK